MVGVITIHVGRSYCLEDVNTLNIVADVIALADVIAMFYVLFLYLRQMFCTQQGKDKNENTSP